MPFFKLVLSFAPWLAFLAISHFGLMGLKIGLAAGLLLSLIMGLAGLHRGVILWCGLAFFSYASVAVIGFGNRWAALHMGILANAALAAGAWGGIAMGNPFSAAYARAHTAQEIWNSPGFTRANNVITAVWAGVFSLNALLAWGKMTRPSWMWEAASYGFLIAAAWFTSWYSARSRQTREQGAGNAV